MKQFSSLFLIVTATAVCVALLSGCPALSPETNEAAAAVSEVYATINADGVVTPEEQATFDAAIYRWFGMAKTDVEGFDWETFFAAVAGGFSTAFLGVNVFRNMAQGKGFVTPKPTP